MKKGIFKQRWRRELRDYALLTILGYAMTATQLTCSHCWDDPRKFIIAGAFTSVLWIALWKGNEYLGEVISHYIDWIRYPVKRFMVGATSTVLYTIGAMYFITLIFETMMSTTVSGGVWISVVITIVISLFMHARIFLLNWRKAAIELEKVQHESTLAKYETLKNQLNPHFLFNSLNALTNLVYEDEDKAVKFIDQLALIYQYVLQTQDKELVPVSEELRFLDAYLYLQRIRFEDKLKVKFEVDGISGDVAPLALQMLIENAIKHNVVSEDDPLYINIHAAGDYLVIENNLQKKRSLGEGSPGIGLENIHRRYELLTPVKVEVQQDEKTFCVKLPIVKNHRQ
jgi:LytS/YehU family sensor histidine kinase